MLACCKIFVYCFLNLFLFLFKAPDNVFYSLWNLLVFISAKKSFFNHQIDDFIWILKDVFFTINTKTYP